MLRINSIIKVVDNSAKECIIIGIFNGKKSAVVGDVVTVAVKSVFIGSNIEKGKVSKAVIVTTKKRYQKNDGEYFFSDNACVLINDDGEPRGSIIFGPVSKGLFSYRKIISLATDII